MIQIQLMKRLMRINNYKPTKMRQFFTILAALGCVVAFGQKPNINKAKAALDKGEIAEAKTIIDQAIDYEKTKDKAKTWYYRGMIYTVLDTANNQPGAMEVALESFSKALELDPTQKTTSEFTVAGLVNVDTKVNAYYSYYYNMGIDKYEKEEFVAAADAFERANVVIPADTSSMLNAAYAAGSAEDNERARRNFEKVKDLGITEIGVFLRLYNYALADDDYDKAYGILTEAREIHPQNVDLQKYQINILIQQDKIEEAKSGIVSAIEQEPQNPDLHFSLGVITEEQGDLEGARMSYSKAIAIDSTHYNSNFNLGVIVFNECNALIKERNGLSYKEEKKFDQLTTQINEKLNTALPYWERLYELKNTEETVLETLKYIYANLRMNDKAEKIADELDALRG